MESNTDEYTDFVDQAAYQARTANPNIVVLAGISTNPGSLSVTAGNLFQASYATRDSVDGYWLNIPNPGAECPRCKSPRPDIALELLHMLDAEAH